MRNQASSYKSEEMAGRPTHSVYGLRESRKVNPPHGYR